MVDKGGATRAGPRAVKHLIRLGDFGRSEIENLLDLSLRLKRRGRLGRLSGRTAGLLFFRGSLRTRTSLEAAMHQLGGQTINLTASSDFWDLDEREGSVMDGKAPEHIKDASAVLSRYVDALVIRPAPAGRSWEIDRKDAQIRSWAAHAQVPVINAESVLWHPLQALADLLTLREKLGSLAGRRLSVVWTHSPTPAASSVVNSLLCATVRFGMDVRVAHPVGYELDASVLAEAQELAAGSGGRLATGLSAEEAVAGADVVYARSWPSLADYGNPTLAASHTARLRHWIIDERLLQGGAADIGVMHAMPVRRNLEIVDAVLDSPRNLMIDQAENRLHTQKAVLSLLLGG